MEEEDDSDTSSIIPLAGAVVFPTLLNSYAWPCQGFNRCFSYDLWCFRRRTVQVVRVLATR